MAYLEPSKTLLPPLDTVPALFCSRPRENIFENLRSKESLSVAAFGRQKGCAVISSCVSVFVKMIQNGYADKTRVLS
jgi:hypothetical protein